MSKPKKISKLAWKLEQLILAAQSRLILESVPDAKERKEESSIFLMEAIDEVSRLIDPEHSYYSGEE